MYSRPLLLTLFCLLFSWTVSAQSPESSLFRSIDGSGNNLENPSWGRAGDNLVRITDVGYTDGMVRPGGENRPNPREVSNTIFAQSGLINDPLSLSDYCWAFGQFIDHDLSLTPDGPEPMMISVPRGDPWFDPMGVGEAVIPMHRNMFDPSTGDSPDNPREHPNVITAFLDGSAVYGSDEAHANWLRSFKGGKLKVSRGNLLPFNTVTGELDGAIDPDAPHMDNPTRAFDKFFVAGDPRVNENPLLIAFHTLFVREHNRICDELAREHPDWDDELLYLQTRKRVAAIIQSIVYNEWLPTMGVRLPEYQGYRADVNPQLFQVFTAAAFRLGHTLLNGTIQRLDAGGDTLPEGNLALRDAFFNPMTLIESGGIEPFLQGMAAQVQQNMDSKVIDDVRNFLFGAPGAGGLDLVSININRGRERGLPDFNTVRRNFGLQPYYFFQQISFNPETASRLNQLYRSIHNVDPWVGMLAETPMRGALFGETIVAIMTRQFANLRDGDRFFYLNDEGLSEEEKKEIHATRLHDVIMRNTGIKLMQENVFEAMPHSEICENMLVEVNGRVRTERGDPVSDVQVYLRAGGNIEQLATESDGRFDFLPVGGCDVRELKLSKSDLAINGVSTIDLILIQKHVLGLSLLDSPYKIIAADVNNSGNISTLDIVSVRKVILGIQREFENNKNWRFVPVSYVFTDPQNPFADGFPEGLDFNVLSQDLDLEYIAIKTGDVNNTAQVTDNVTTPVIAGRSDESGLNLYIADRELRRGESVTVQLTSSELSSLQGYQFSLAFDRQALRFEGFNTAGELPGLSAEHFGVFQEEGLITTSWNNSGPISLQDGSALFGMTFQVLQDGYLRERLQMGERPAPNAYDQDLHEMPVRLMYESMETEASAFALYQNQPNPFREQTVIPFFLPESGDATLTIFDAAGRGVYTRRNAFGQGEQQWTIQRSDLPGASGVLYYRLDTDQGAATRQMLLVD